MTKVVAIFENGIERDVIFADGSSITQFYSRAMKTWVCIPENDESEDETV
jgi:hypothetical protein